MVRQAPLSMGFSWQVYWSGLPFPPPEDLPYPGIKSISLKSPALAGEFFTIVPTRMPINQHGQCLIGFPHWSLIEEQHKKMGFQMEPALKNLPANPGDKRDAVQFLGQEDPPKEMATHASILAWRIPWTEEPDGLQFMGLQRIRHD